jgi:hypothetical protein
LSDDRVRRVAEYVAMWLRDSGEVADLAAYDAQLQGLEEAYVEGVGMGFVRIRRTDAAAALVGASEGMLKIAALLAAIASVLGEDPNAFRQRLLPGVRDLVDQGVLEPA